MPHPYTEDQLVEQPAIGLFAALGWQTVCVLGETFGAGSTLGRETKEEVVLIERLRAALVKLNPALPAEAINVSIDKLTRACCWGRSTWMPFETPSNLRPHFHQTI